MDRNGYDCTVLVHMLYGIDYGSLALMTCDTSVR